MLWQWWLKKEYGYVHLFLALDAKVHGRSRRNSVSRKAYFMRTRFLTSTLHIFLLALLWTRSVAQSSDVAAPAYLARTDRTIQQNADPVPNVGGLTGAGACVILSDFNLRVCRLTDANLDPSLEDQTHVTTTSGSGDTNLWNTDSHLLVLQGSGGRVYPMAFNPATMHARRLYTPSYPATGGFYARGGGPAWSYANSTLLYFINDSVIESYDFRGYDKGENPPSAVELFDFIAGRTGSWGTTTTNCLPSSYKATWRSFGMMSKDPADHVFLLGLSQNGGQNTGGDVVAYRVGSGCTYLNTLTGTVTGDWGATGSVTIPDRPLSTT
jgi:hypothetical protein